MASGSSRRSWMARLSGRAPNCGWKPSLAINCLAERSTSRVTCCLPSTPAAATDQEQARRCFAQLDESGAALDQPEALKIIQSYARVMRKMRNK